MDKVYLSAVETAAIAEGLKVGQSFKAVPEVLDWAIDQEIYRDFYRVDQERYRPYVVLGKLLVPFKRDTSRQARVMKRAWAYKRMVPDALFSECLKEAWADEKRRKPEQMNLI